MNLCSVIIPTVQKKLSVLLELLNTLEADKFVDEILVINNKPEVPLRFGGYYKVRVIQPKENLYVNPSWNLGIEECKNNNFLLLNDDLLICPDLIGSVMTSDVFNDPKTGLLGAANQSIVQFNSGDTETLLHPDSDDEIKFLPLTNYLGTGDWGISIFGKKENYYKIPDDLKIIYGDNYILYKNLQNNKLNYQIAGKTYHHIHSSSSASAEFSNVVCADCTNQEKYFVDEIVNKEPDPQELEELKEKYNYSIKFQNNVCFITIKDDNDSESVMCVRHKDENGTVSKSELYSTFIDFSIEQDLSNVIADDIIAQSKTC